MIDWAKVPPGVWVFLSSVAILVLTKFSEQWLKRKDDDRADRKEYREEIVELRGRVDSLEQQVVLWRDRYYSEQMRSQQYYFRLLQAGIDPGTSPDPDPPSAAP